MYYKQALDESDGEKRKRKETEAKRTSGRRKLEKKRERGNSEPQKRKQKFFKKVLTNPKGFGNIPKALDERNQRREPRDDFVFQGSRQERKLSEAAEKNKKS